MDAVTVCSNFGAQENKVCHCFHCFPVYFPWSDGTRCYEFFKCWILSQLFHSPLSPSSRGSLVPLRFLPLETAYLRLLIFLLVILIPACASSNLVFPMMYSACKLNNQSGSIHCWCTPFKSPMNSMKEQKDMTPEDEPPSLVKSGEIAPERMKRPGQSRNDTQLWIYLVVKVKFML